MSDTSAPQTAQYDRSRERLLATGSADGIESITLLMLLADITVETVPYGTEIELYGYGNDKRLRLVDFDPDPTTKALTISSDMPYVGGSAHINRFSIGESVISSGNRSIAAMNIGSVNLSGNGTIDGVPFDEYKKAQNGESESYIVAGGRLIDLTRKVHLRLVVPKRLKMLRFEKCHGRVTLTGDLDGQLRVNAEYGFMQVSAKIVGELWLLFGNKTATAEIETVTGACRLNLDDGAVAIVNGTRHTG